MSGNTPENRYFIMTLFGVFGGEGSALYVDCRWSPRSGSIGIFSSQRTCGDSTVAAMVGVIMYSRETLEAVAWPSERECGPNGINVCVKGSRLTVGRLKQT
jgi:hypothetical protein